MTRLWDKETPLDKHILNFTAGDDHRLDTRLVKYDVLASIAHVQMLTEKRLLSLKDCEVICDGLTALGEQHARGEWSISLEEEDAHGALESRLVDRIGPTGGRMHLGRSRNDQVLVALRLYLKDTAEVLQAGAEGGSEHVAHVAAVLDEDVVVEAQLLSEPLRYLGVVALPHADFNRVAGTKASQSEGDEGN